MDRIMVISGGDIHFQVSNAELEVQLEAWAKWEHDVIPNAKARVRRYMAGDHEINPYHRKDPSRRGFTR